MSRAVIDQPGIRIIVVGLALSVFLGLAIRAQISESRIQAYLDRTVDRLQKEFAVDYGSARVNLSSWGLPLPALVVQNIRLSPKGALCQNSQIFVDELEVPISISAILGLSNKIPKIRARSVELRLSDIENCINRNQTAGTETGAPVPTTPVNGEPPVTPPSADVKDVFSKQTRAELKEVYIERLKIISSKKPDQPVLLKQLNVEFAYHENRLRGINLNSKINAIRDPRSDLYFLNADMAAVFKSDEHNQIETLVDIKGKLLDGDARVFLHSFSHAGKISYELALERVSLKAALPFLESVEQSRIYNLERTPSSVSLTSMGEIFLEGSARAEAKFKNVQASIGSGQLKVDQLELVYRDGKTRIRPFVLSIGNLALSNLKNFGEMQKTLDSFESLGELSGSFAYTDEDTYRFRGEVRNIQTVFSNRGRRDLQSIDQAGLQISRSGTELKVQGADFIIGGQAAPGKFDATYNFDNFRTQAQFRIAGKIFSEKIWEQFTYVEQSPHIELLWNYRKHGTEVHDLKIEVENLALPGVELNRLDVNLSQELAGDPARNSVRLSIRPARVSADRSFLEHPVVAQILNVRYGFKLKALTSTRTQLLFSGSDWKNIGFTLDSYFLSDLNLRSDTHLTLKGVARYGTGLSARLAMQTGRQSSKFDLSSEPEGGIHVKPLQ